MKKFKFIIALMIISVFSLALVSPALAQDDGTLDPWKETDIDFLGSKDPRQIAADLIKVVLGFLGIIAVVIILLGGFKWMTASGNQDKVDEAKRLIMAGIIGLVIILGSYAIAQFILTNLMTATGAVTE